VTWRVAAGVPDLRAAVPFYGVPVQEPDVPGIGAAVLAIYGGLDERINQNIRRSKRRWAARQDLRKIVYPNVDHAFHNDTGARYNAAAAKAAWGEALAWFGNTWRRKIHDVEVSRGTEHGTGRTHAGVRLRSSSFGGGAPPHAVDFGRRDFLIDALAATADSPDSALRSARRASEQPADTILVNARIATLAPRAPAASALAIRGASSLRRVRGRDRGPARSEYAGDRRGRRTVVPG